MQPNTPAVAQLPDADPPRRIALHWKILIGLAIGAALGLGANYFASVPIPQFGALTADVDRNGIDDRLDWLALNVADPLGRVFLRLVLMVVLPLVFCALVLGVLELGDMKRLGRVGTRTLAYAMLFSMTAVAIGVGLVNLIGPGRSLPEADRETLKAQYAPDVKVVAEKAEAARPLHDALLDLIPENPLQEMVGAIDGSSKGNGMLAVMVFALIFGIALTLVRERAQVLINALTGLFEVTMVIIGFAMRLAPFGVACLVFAITARLGPNILTTLAWFVATVLTGLAIQMFVIYPLALTTLAGLRPWKFFRDTSEAMVTAFGTSSSNATLPTALRVAREKLRMPPEISRFVLTVGSTGNQNGTALYEGVVVLFLAQVFGVHLALSEQILVVLMSILTGIGTAGVPGGSIPLIIVLLSRVNVPPEGIGIILGVDRVLDMCRTAVNVQGDLVLAACVARDEEEEGEEGKRQKAEGRKNA